MNQKKRLKIPLHKINKQEIISLKDDQTIWLASLGSVILVGLSVVFILFSWSSLPPQLPLFFSRPWGEAQLAFPLFLWLLPGIALLNLIVNLGLTIIIFKEAVTIRRIIALSSFLTSLLFAISLYQIVTLVT